MEIIKLVGRWNDLELGYIENNTYYKTDLLKDHEHSWKILEWIDQNIQDGFSIRVVKEIKHDVAENMMEASKRENKEALMKIIEWAFRNIK